jgi:hypothetical protein
MGTEGENDKRSKATFGRAEAAAITNAAKAASTEAAEEIAGRFITHKGVPDRECLL